MHIRIYNFGTRRVDVEKKYLQLEKHGRKMP